jgi:hypothetical protein
MSSTLHDFNKNRISQVTSVTAKICNYITTLSHLYSKTQTKVNCYGIAGKQSPRPLPPHPPSPKVKK